MTNENYNGSQILTTRIDDENINKCMEIWTVLFNAIFLNVTSSRTEDATDLDHTFIHNSTGNQTKTPKVNYKKNAANWHCIEYNIMKAQQVFLILLISKQVCRSYIQKLLGLATECTWVRITILTNITRKEEVTLLSNQNMSLCVSFADMTCGYLFSNWVILPCRGRLSNNINSLPAAGY